MTDEERSDINRRTQRLELHGKLVTATNDYLNVITDKDLPDSRPEVRRRWYNPPHCPVAVIDRCKTLVVVARRRMCCKVCTKSTYKHPMKRGV